jgi:ABC-2 type transport system permease protein
MNIYLRELRAHLKSTVIWSVSAFLLVLLGMIKYTAASGSSAGNFNEMMGLLPKSLQNIFGIGVFDLAVPIEYYAVLFLYIALMAALHAVLLGNGIISKEERDKTVEFLMVKPVSRGEILTSKLFASLTMLAVLNIVIFSSSIAALSKYPDYSYIGGLSKLCLALFGIQLLFCSMGALFAGLTKNTKLSASLSTGVLLFMFMLSIIADITEKADFLKYFSFFKYFDARLILKEGYSPVYPAVSIILAVLFVCFTYVSYKKRDMRL